MDYTNYFTHSKRVDGATYCYLRDDSPEALRDLVYAIHRDHFDGCLPNDWLYAQIFDAFSNDPQVDPQTDVYNHDLTKWLHENAFAIGVCNEAVEQMGCGEMTDIIGWISLGQLYALQMIHDAVSVFLEAQDD